MDVDIRTRRATGAACWEISIELEKTRLRGRGSRNAGSADKIRMGRRLVADGETRDGRGRLHGHLRGRLRDGRMAYMADLAVIFVVGLIVPVAYGVGSQQRKRKQGRDGQEPPGGALGNAGINQVSTSNVLS